MKEFYKSSVRYNILDKSFYNIMKNLNSDLITKLRWYSEFEEVYLDNIRTIISKQIRGSLEYRIVAK
jgi:hypothetical protein